MKYIRTKDGIFQWKQMTTEQMMFYLNAGCIKLGDETDGKIADTIEKLCDEFIYIKGNYKTIHKPYAVCLKDDYEYEDKIYGAIWTDKGLIYVAKMKDVLPNCEIDWELL